MSASELKQRLLVVTSRLRSIDTQQQQLTLERATLAAKAVALQVQCEASEHGFEPEPELREVIMRALKVRARPSSDALPLTPHYPSRPLSSWVQKQLGGKEPRGFQVHATAAMLTGRDVFVARQAGAEESDVQEGCGEEAQADVHVVPVDEGACPL